MQLRRLALVLGLLAAACGGGDGGDGGGTQAAGPAAACAESRRKAEVFALMRDVYLYNDEAEQQDRYRRVDPAAEPDAESLLEALRFRPDSHDRGFSHIARPEEEAAFYEEGEFVGFGFGLALEGDVLRVLQVFDGGPAAEAGVARGWVVTAIDGEAVGVLAAEGRLDAALGPAEAGFTARLRFADRAGRDQGERVLAKRVVAIDPVPVWDVFEFGGVPVGYLLLRSFIGPASAAFDEAFAGFQAAAVAALIVDLRYNGGGRLDIAAELAGRLAPARAGQPLVYLRFNAAHAEEDTEVPIRQIAPAWDAPRLVFITSGLSASASELVIHGLAPYFAEGEFFSVGARSFGKPVGQTGHFFCDGEWILRPVTFRIENVAGEGDYYDGLPVDCPAADDFGHDLGDPEEAMLATALGVARDGACPGGFAAAAAPGARVSPLRPLRGRGPAEREAAAY